MAIFHALNRLDKAFEISIILKGLDGLLETVGGLLLLFIDPQRISGLISNLTQHELSQDPHDFIANHLLHTAQHFTRGGSTFAAVYLLSHGLSKVILVFAILREQLWAYKGMIGLLIVFIIYQLYKIAFDPALWLIVLTLFDCLVLYLTIREYGKQRVRLGRAGTN